MVFLVAVAGTIILLDQLTKLLILYYVPVNTGHVVIPGFFNLIHVRNTGGAFSMLAGADATWRLPFFVAMTLIVVGIIVWAYRKIDRRELWTRTAYALICGGALGNLSDRLRFGEVVDFLELHIGTYSWPAFNVGDSAISAGAVMLIIALLRGK
ncbi:MAG TPA: signal peptidase II [Syntrophobacter fumaroxidans]|nr:signal peptidase II [Syntrophobacter fumaroxidans]